MQMGLENYKEMNDLWFKALNDRCGGSKDISIDCNVNSLLWWRDMKHIDIGVLENSEVYLMKERNKALRVVNRTKSSIEWSVVWHKMVPSKVLCLTWRLFHNRLPTKRNLVRRGVLA